MRGWLELGSIAALLASNRMAATPQLEAWRTRYPNHPALEIARSELFGATPTVPVAPLAAGAQVALLLPVSGRQAGAGASVRDGFFAAYYRLPEVLRPEVRVYDTGALSVASAISQANADGAQFIVGPLTREETLAAADLTSRRAPMLAR